MADSPDDNNAINEDFLSDLLTDENEVNRSMGRLLATDFTNSFRNWIASEMDRHIDPDVVVPAALKVTAGFIAILLKLCRMNDDEANTEKLATHCAKIFKIILIKGLITLPDADEES